MPATHVLGKRLRTLCQGIHAWRLAALIAMVEALLRGRVLTVTGLGRALRGASAPKHHIKKADRLIGNRHLHRERHAFYRVLMAVTIGGLKRPVILIDWSDVTAARAFQMLRASVAVAPGVHSRSIKRSTLSIPLRQSRGASPLSAHAAAPAAHTPPPDHRHRCRLQEPVVPGGAGIRLGLRGPGGRPCHDPAHGPGAGLDTRGAGVRGRRQACPLLR